MNQKEKSGLTAISISSEQAKVLLEIYLAIKNNEYRDLVEVYGWETLSELAALDLISSEKSGETTDFFFTGKGYELAKVLDHEKNGTPYDHSYLRVARPDDGSN